MQKRLTEMLVLVAIVTMMFAGMAVGEVNTKATPTASGAKAAATKTDLNRTTYSFIQEGTNGTFVKDGSGNYTLTITGVIPYTIYFSDRPARDAGMSPMKDFLKNFCFGSRNPPNAMVMLKDEAKDHDMIVVELTSPKYDETNKTLKYTAKVLDNYTFKSNWAQDLLPMADPAIPESFGRVIIVIDDCPDGTVECYGDNVDCGSAYIGCCYEFQGCEPCHSQEDYNELCAETYGSSCGNAGDASC